MLSFCVGMLTSFAGGGVKGCAFLGALEVLEQHQVLQRCKRFAGSSAGAITASLLACGYLCSEVSAMMQSQSW
jgi:NTE family protein